jgi:ATP phosphoribosyltransferase regulatory subunit
MNSYIIENELKSMLLKLPELNGGKDTIDKARAIFLKASDDVKNALADLETIAEKLARRFPSMPISFDLAELRGYHYHTGMVFAAFIPSVGREIARGGRYDNIGEVFGRARPATGFSADLKVLSSLSKQSFQLESRELIFAPYSDDSALSEKIRDLRARQQAVVQQLPGQTGSAKELGCTSVLEFDNQNWVVRPLA